MTIRLYVDHELRAGLSIETDERTRHYVCNVMRRQEGDEVRLVNGRDGEWSGVIELAGKRRLVIRPQRQERPQIDESGPVLLFSPIRKHRMSWLIEKSVELGAAGLRPVMMQHTDARLDRRDRIERQIIEAVEQCERLTVPVLDAPVDFAALIQDRSLFPVIVGVARDDAPPALDVMARTQIASILVGPEGGFAEKEIDAIRENPGFLPVSLGANILRAETAALSLLCLWQAARRVQT